jgi:hypothetical protein
MIYKIWGVFWFFAQLFVVLMLGALSVIAMVLPNK